MNHRSWLALPAAFAIVVGACSGSAATSAPTTAPQSQAATEAPASSAPASPSADPNATRIKLGFVTHVIGNPFIQQIIDGANAAAKDLNVDLQVTGPEGGDADAQLKAVQSLVAAGAQGIATSVPGESMTVGLNEIVDSGIPVVQFNLLVKGVKAPYVGERSVESGRILGAKVLEKLGGDSATGNVILGNCFPGFPVLENRAKGATESLSKAAGIKILGPFDVKVAANENYAAWEALLAANPDAKALVGLCAPDIASLGKLQAANADKPFVSGGYDLTAENLAEIKAGHAYLSLGQTPFMQGYLPVKMLADKVRGLVDVDLSKGGFLDAGTEIVTADSVTEPYNLPPLTFAQLEELAASPDKARAYYQPHAGDGPSPSPAVVPLIEAAGLRKQYGGIVALDGVDLTVHPGTVHAIVGENGAGKSTLMKALAGAIRPDAGEIRVRGTAVDLPTPMAARALGIGIVYQELSLFPERSILANLFVEQEPTRRGIVDRAAMAARAAPVLARMGLDVDPATPVRLLGIGERQLVELSRLLIERPDVLILDEPNSALNERETSRLFAVLRELSAAGITILYVSHRLEEVFSIADTITVMRNARVVFERPRAATTIPEVVREMIGTSQEHLFPPRAAVAPTDAPGLDVRDLAVDGELDGISFSARPGEILGLAGLEGAGVSTLLGVLFGTRHADRGTVRFPDGGGAPRSPTDAARRGVGLVPADRRNLGLMLDASIARNIAHVTVGALRATSPWLRRRDLVEPARRQIADLHVKADGPGMLVGQLSGGNQQKVVVGKWLEIAPGVMLLDDPTRGVDVGAKREIYVLVRRLAGEGRIVLFRSTELPELVGLADRVLVFYRGRLAGEAPGEGLDDRRLLHAINTGDLAGTAA